MEPNMNDKELQDKEPRQTAKELEEYNKEKPVIGYFQKQRLMKMTKRVRTVISKYKQKQNRLIEEENAWRPKIELTLMELTAMLYIEIEGEDGELEPISYKNMALKSFDDLLELLDEAVRNVEEIL